MALQKSIENIETKVITKYIRIEFIYLFNEKVGDKKAFVRIGSYTSKDATKFIDFIEKQYTYKELEYTGEENIYSLIYNKLIKTDFEGVERID